MEPWRERIYIAKVSVVLPVYNVARYLERCIVSIQKQVLEDIQIILVNDGSTDNSLSICQDFAQKDERIIVIDKPNGGVSSARNAGMEAATGEYIGFVDPDDWIDPEMYQSMVDQVKQDQADICICNYTNEMNGKSTPVSLKVEQDLLHTKEDITQELILNMLSVPSLNSNAQALMGNVWRLLIKREFINKHSLDFPLGIPFMEDLLFCVRAFAKSSKISVHKGFYYHYVIHSNSAATSYRKNMAGLQKQVFARLERILKEENIYIAAQERLNIRYVKMCISSIAHEAHKTNHKNLKEKLKTISDLCDDEKLKSILESLDTRGYAFRRKLVLASMKYNFAACLYLYYYIYNLPLKGWR